VLVAGRREVTVMVGRGVSGTFSVRVTCSCCAGTRLVTVAPSEARVSIYVVLPSVWVFGDAVLPMRGSQALAPIVSPSCSTTVGRALRWLTITGGTKEGLGIAVSGMISDAKVVVGPRSRVDVWVTQVVAIASTSK